MSAHDNLSLTPAIFSSGRISRDTRHATRDTRHATRNYVGAIRFVKYLTPEFASFFIFFLIFSIPRHARSSSENLVSSPRFGETPRISRGISVFHESELFTHTPHIRGFLLSEQGKRARYAARWRNNKGEKNAGTFRLDFWRVPRF